MMNSLDNWATIDMNMSYWSGNMVFDTGIWYNNNCKQIRWSLENNILKFVQVTFDTAFTISV